MFVSAIIVAAGSGQRLGLKTPKAFVRIAGRPMAEHSLIKFSKLGNVRELVLVAPNGHNISAASLRRRFPKLAAIVPGGAERTDSVRAGLSALSPRSQVVLVHDAARPLVSSRDIAAVITAAARHGAAVLAEPMSDTVKRAERGFVLGTVERGNLWRAQTPQGFRREIILNSHLGKRLTRATDDSTLAESMGIKAALVPATGPNFKITTKTDLEMASWLLGRKRPA